MEAIKLSNGVQMPRIGYGTWRIPDEEVTQLVLTAAQVGYRHFDTAARYNNERGVGRAIQEIMDRGIASRDELFVTTKVWNDSRGYDKAMAAFDRSMQALGLDVLDLCLIHWPAAPHQFENWKELNNGTWKALETVYREGRVRSIGVSNFKIHHLQPLLENAQIQPMVNQIEIHPGLPQLECIEFCQSRGIVVEAWSPLGTGRMVVNEELAQIAQRYQCTTAQLCLRYLTQKNIVPLPKSFNEGRMKQNLVLPAFDLSAQDMALIDAMPYFGGSGEDPDKISF